MAKEFTFDVRVETQTQGASNPIPPLNTVYESINQFQYVRKHGTGKLTVYVSDSVEELHPVVAIKNDDGLNQPKALLYFATNEQHGLIPNMTEGVGADYKAKYEDASAMQVITRAPSDHGNEPYDVDYGVVTGTIDTVQSNLGYIGFPENTGQLGVGSYQYGHWYYSGSSKVNDWDFFCNIPKILVNEASDWNRVWLYLASGNEQLLDFPADDFPDEDDPEAETSEEDNLDNAEDNRPEDPTNDFTKLGTACNYHVISVEQLNNFFNWYWHDMVDQIADQQGIFYYLSGFFENLGQSIVNIQVYPFDVPHPTDSTKEIQLGRFNSGVYTFKLSKASYQLFYTEFNINEDTKLNKDGFKYMNYSPYTELHLYLPWIGLRQIDTNRYMNTRVYLEYRVDFSSGSVDVYMGRIKGDKAITEDHFTGRIGAVVPYTLDSGKSLDQICTESAVNGLISATKSMGGMAIGMATGNTLAAASVATNVANTIDQTLQEGQSTSYSASSSNQNVLAEPNNIQLFRIRPDYNVSGRFVKTYGRPCNRGVTVKNLNGFAQFNNPKIEYGHTERQDHIICPTATEQQMIYDLLQEGVYV